LGSGVGGSDGGGGELTDLEGDAGFVAAVDGDVDGVVAGFFEFEVLDVNDEITREKIAVVGEHDVGGEFDAGHDGAAVLVDEVHADLVGALLDAAEDDTEGDGALRMDGGELVGDDGIEGAEQVKFAGVISGGIAEHGDLNVHRRGTVVGYGHESNQIPRISLTSGRDSRSASASMTNRTGQLLSGALRLCGAAVGL
jgi:hypothetical protein